MIRDEILERAPIAGPPPLDRIFPGMYGCRDPIAYYFDPLERTRHMGLPEDAASLQDITDRARAQFARELPGVPFFILESGARS